MVSNTVISEPCTNKRSKPEMATQSQIGLRSQQFQIQVTIIEARQLSGNLSHNTYCSMKFRRFKYNHSLSPTDVGNALPMMKVF